MADAEKTGTNKYKIFYMIISVYFKFKKFFVNKEKKNYILLNFFNIKEDSQNMILY